MSRLPPSSARQVLRAALRAGLLFLFCASRTTYAGAGRIDGTVSDPAGDLLSGVTVTLFSSTDDAPRATVTDEAGTFHFEGLPASVYKAVASLEGYRETVSAPIELEGDGDAFIELTLPLAYSEEILIEEDVDSPDIDDPQAREVFPFRTLTLLPLATDRFVETLPLVPGVVRGPDGRLNFNGARAAQSILLVNGSNVTDPLTGEFSIELPLKAIETVEVHSIPYSAEFGRVTAAVTQVRTRAGGDEWELELGSLLPSLRFRDGTIQGIRSATPRFQISGPLKEGRSWISQGATFRFVRSRAYDVAEGEDEQVLESFDSFTQLDIKLGESHWLTATLSYFPVEVDNLGIDTLHPEEATPDFNSRGWNVAFAERSTLGSRTFLETSFAVKRFDVAVTPKSEEAARLTPPGLRGNYFNEIDRESKRWDLNVSLSHSVPDLRGPHVLKLGTNIASRSFEGMDRGGRVDVEGPGGRLIRTIEFIGPSEIEASDLEISGYIQDQWRLIPRLGLDLGMRFDYDRMTRCRRLSPRLAFAFSPRADDDTMVKGGWGVFYDQVYLHAAAFESFQKRVETDYGPDGRPVGAPLVFENRLAPEGLYVPRSTTWNLELNQMLGRDWMLRVNYRERRGSDELVVDRLPGASEGPVLRLGSGGLSWSKEFDVTLRRSLPEDGELFMAYVKARTLGELNDFGAVYKDSREPLLLENEYSLQPFDVPHRFLLWGVVYLPKGIVVVPGLEWRSGFPYTVLDENYAVSGERNRGGRFPSFLSADLRFTKEIAVFGRQARVGFQLFNLTSHFNPRDIIANLGSPEFGALRNSRGITGGLRLEVGF